MLSTNTGFQNLLKEGHKHYSGLEEAILRNIEACKGISNITKTSLGPNGMKKMVINHIEKIFVTSDAATIMREMEVNHPAAKMISMASKMQESEFGDASNFVVTFAGELLSQAESLIKMGLHPSQIVLGYEAASKKVAEILEAQKTYELKDIRNSEEVTQLVTSAVTPKLQAYGHFFGSKIAEACVGILPKDAKNFNLENIRTAKILGGSLSDSFVVRGLVVSRGTETSITEATNAKVVIYSCPLEPQAADTKGTVLIKNAEELLNYNQSEEDHAHKLVKGIADAGCKVVVVGGTISEIVLHFLERYKLMTVRLTSKFELRRVCKALGATALVRLGAPTAEEIGEASSVSVEEIGSQRVTVFKRDDKDECRLATIVLRGSTSNLLDDVERAIEDGVNAFRNLARDGRFVNGAGASEIALARELETIANTITGLDQYSFKQYAKSFEIIPRILAENAGLNVDDIIAKLYSSHASGKPSGIDIENATVKSSEELKIYDHLETKAWAIRLASDAAITVLRVDQIIISKPAGGPKPQKNTNWDEDQ